jgi:hypothetical protein
MRGGKKSLIDNERMREISMRERERDIQCALKGCDNNKGKRKKRERERAQKRVQFRNFAFTLKVESIRCSGSRKCSSTALEREREREREQKGIHFTSSRERREGEIETYSFEQIFTVSVLLQATKPR